MGIADNLQRVQNRIQRRHRRQIGQREVFVYWQPRNVQMPMVLLKRLDWDTPCLGKIVHRRSVTSMMRGFRY